MATKHIDLNCDMGESYGRWTLGADEEIMPWITSANVACGFHGGDPHVMRKTVALALRHGVAIGSHPGLPDLMGFGRRVMDVTPQEVKDYLCYQTGALREFVRAAGGDLQHLKPHGILYNMMEKEEALAVAAGEAVLESGGKELILMTLASGKYDAACRKMGVLAMAGKVRTLDGVEIDISVQTICCHGDTPGAQKIVRMVREALDKAGCRVRPLREWLPKA